MQVCRRGAPGPRRWAPHLQGACTLRVQVQVCRDNASRRRECPVGRSCGPRCTRQRRADGRDRPGVAVVEGVLAVGHARAGSGLDGDDTRPQRRCGSRWSCWPSGSGAGTGRRSCCPRPRFDTALAFRCKCDDVTVLARHLHLLQGFRSTTVWCMSTSLSTEPSECFLAPLRVAATSNALEMARPSEPGLLGSCSRAAHSACVGSLGLA